MNDIRMAVAMTEAKASIDREDGDLTDKIKAAMKCTKDHWMCTNETDQFIAAIGAVMNHYGKDSAEHERLLNEV